MPPALLANRPFMQQSPPLPTPEASLREEGSFLTSPGGAHTPLRSSFSHHFTLQTPRDLWPLSFPLPSVPGQMTKGAFPAAAWSVFSSTVPGRELQDPPVLTTMPLPITSEDQERLLPHSLLAAPLLRTQPLCPATGSQLWGPTASQPPSHCIMTTCLMSPWFQTFSSEGLCPIPLSHTSPPTHTPTAGIHPHLMNESIPSYWLNNYIYVRDY